MKFSKDLIRFQHTGGQVLPPKRPINRWFVPLVIGLENCFGHDEKYVITQVDLNNLEHTLDVSEIRRSPPGMLKKNCK